MNKLFYETLTCEIWFVDLVLVMGLTEYSLILRFSASGLKSGRVGLSNVGCKAIGDSLFLFVKYFN